MDPKDFLKTAEFLKAQDGEHYIRTSIGRSYYAIHLHIRYFISNTFLGQKTFKSNPHDKILHCLQFCDAPDIKNIGINLTNLRQARTDADYKMAKLITLTKCEDVYDDAIDLLNDFEEKISIPTNRQELAKSSRQVARNEAIIPR